MKAKSKVGWGVLVLAGSVPLLAAAPPEFPSTETLRELRSYIKNAWTTLSRSNRDLTAAAPDPKMKRAPGQPWPVYISAREDRARVERDLRGQLTAEEMARIELRTLPADLRGLKEHGLLYLPRPYVVPGGRFNEMYG